MENFINLQQKGQHSSVLIKHYASTPINLAFIDLKLKPTSNSVTKRSSENNPLTNIKLKDRSKQKLRKWNIVFKSKGHKPCLPKKSPDTCAIVQNLRKSKMQQREKQKWRNTYEKQLDEYQRALEAQSDILNAKLNLSQKYNSKSERQNIQKNFKLKKPIKIHKMNFNPSGGSNFQPQAKGWATCRESYQKPSQDFHKNLQTLNFGRQASQQLFKRKNCKSINFKRDLKSNSKNKRSSPILLKRSATMKMMAVKNFSIPTEESSLLLDKYRSQSENLTFRISGSRAPKLQFEIPWASRPLTDNKHRKVVY